MRSVIRAIGLVVFSLCLLANPSAAQRALPDDNLAYPVLVAIPGVEEASGFYLNTPTATYLVTAKHVLFSDNGQLRGPMMTLLSYAKDPKESGVNRFLVNLAKLNHAGEIKAHSTADVVVVRVAEVLPNTGDSTRVMLQALPGVSTLEVSNSGVLGVAPDAVKKYDDVLIGNDVLLFGYPTSLGIRGSPQLDSRKPLLRKGIVAGLKPDSKSIILDCPVYYGNSGGPVVEVDRNFLKSTFEVIGVVSQFVPFDENLINHTSLPSLSNSGYSIVTPMDYVLELIK
jgi:hypothetical protein